MSTKYVLALDQGTTSSRAILFDNEQNIIAVQQREFEQIYPQQGWVEHNPMEIWSTQYGVMNEVVAQSGVDVHDIAAIGITNQRETTILWEKATGRPIYNAIVWQCRRTAPLVDELLQQPGMADYIRENTGLMPDAYFSATKIKWILDNVPGARERAEAGEILFGTVDTWLVWKLTGGRVHVTDRTNASRTMLYNIRTLDWDDTLLKALDIPRCILPRVTDSSEVYGTTDLCGVQIPVAGIAGDQQAALFGQSCFGKGEAKNTYGTGCFMLMNTGETCVTSEHGLVSTIGIAQGGKISYALEGSIFHAGATIQWLRDKLGLISSAKEASDLCRHLDSNGGCYLVPAFSGLGAPWWDPDARGLICGLTGASDRATIVRAACESMAYQSFDVLHSMERDAGVKLEYLSVDGGASQNEFIMQFQADLLGIPVVLSENVETTALGAAYLAGLAVGYWEDLEDLEQNRVPGKRFEPSASEEVVARNLSGWHDAVERARSR